MRVKIIAKLIAIIILLYSIIFRRRQCEASAKILGVKSLRDATLEDVSKAEKNGLFKGEEETFRRARHVVSEIIRTDKASKCLKDREFETFGKFMVESHNSLRYEKRNREEIQN